MSGLDRGACYADHAWHGTVTVVRNEPIARDTYLLRFDCPPIAKRIVPGQFIMLRLANFDDPLLGRPLALYDTVLGPGGGPQGLDVVYLTVGKQTHKLAGFRPGQPLEIWGPLGNGFPPQPFEHLIMAAGGIGQTPFLALAQEYQGRRVYGDPARQVPPAKRMTLCYGARTAALLAGIADFERAGVEVRISTDDGSAGHHGLVTDLLRQVLNENPSSALPGALPTQRVICCGPERMMAAVAEIAKARGVACQVSLETPMACGIGICFSCVAKIRDAGGGWDYRRTCVEGPVFDAAAIEF